MENNAFISVMPLRFFKKGIFVWGSCHLRPSGSRKDPSACTGWQLWQRDRFHLFTFPRTKSCELLPEHGAFKMTPFFFFKKGMWVCHWEGRWLTSDVVVYSLRLRALSWGPCEWRAHRELRGSYFLLQTSVQRRMLCGLNMVECAKGGDVTQVQNCMSNSC